MHEKVAIAVGEKELNVLWQVGGELRKSAVQIDIDDDDAEHASGRAEHRRRQLDGWHVPHKAGADFVVDGDTREVCLAGGEPRGIEDVGVVPFLLQFVAGHAHQLGAIAIDAHMFKAVIVQRDQAHLVVARVGLHDELEELGQLILRRRILRLQRCASRRMLRQDMQVAHDLVARQRDAPGQHFGGRQQLVLGGSDQKIAADVVGAVRRHARCHRNDDGEQDTQARGDTELHGASTLPRRSPETMRAHRSTRRSTSSTGCSQINASLSRRWAAARVVESSPWRPVSTSLGPASSM